MAELKIAVGSVRFSDKKVINNAWNNCLLLVIRDLRRYYKPVKLSDGFSHDISQTCAGAPACSRRSAVGCEVFV